MPGCDVILVERSFSFLAGLDIRIGRIAASAIKEGTIHVGTPQCLMVTRDAGMTWSEAFKSKKKRPATMVEI